MSLGSWLRNLFATTSPEEAAAEREEYSTPGETDLEREEYRAGFLSREGTEAAEHELDEEIERRDEQH
jgi:hypothetical protein